MFLLKKLIKLLLMIIKCDKKTEAIDLIETNVYGTSKDLASKKEEIKSNNIIKRYKND